MDDEPEGLRRKYFPRLEGEERQRALEDPGPTWGEWFFASFAKTWTVLGFLVLDVFVFDSWSGPWFIPGVVGSLAAAFYLEWLAYEYLWHRPPTEARRSHRTVPPSRWIRPVFAGRWSIETLRARSGRGPVPVRPPVESPTVDPREFL